MKTTTKAWRRMVRLGIKEFVVSESGPMTKSKVRRLIELRRQIAQAEALILTQEQRADAARARIIEGSI